MTTMSSTRVKPFVTRFKMTSTFPVWNAVQPGGRRKRIHIEYIFTRRRGIGRACITAQALGGGGLY